MADKLLAFDTSTDILSIAVRHGDHVAEHRGAGGAQSSTTLIPLILRLLAEADLALGELDAIVFGRGPGSFTGLRTACAVAQGLGWGAGVPLLPVDTLHAVAEEARHRFGLNRVVAVLDARMDQVYAARFAFDAPRGASDAPERPVGIDAGTSIGADTGMDTDPGTSTDRDTDAAQREPRLLAPEALVVPEGWTLAGNAFAAYGDRLARGVPRHEALPTATALLRLAPALLAAGHGVAPAEARPLYVRDKVAQTTEERAAAKATAATATAEDSKTRNPIP
jgi:tRNA threonylcarbamoyladenosine biosynthesis protein TsaB